MGVTLAVPAIIGVIQLVEQLLPAAEGLAPLVQKALNQTQFNDTDLVSLDNISQQLNTVVEQAAAAAEGATTVPSASG